MRLDCAWGEPIKPHYYWSLDKIYMPDTWHADLPDTFAILPRNTSDYYFSIDDLFKPRVICLGGPNFEIKTLEHTSLEAEGFTHSEISVIMKEDCRTKFPRIQMAKSSKSPWRFTVSLCLNSVY